MPDKMDRIVIVSELRLCCAKQTARGVCCWIYKSSVYSKAPLKMRTVNDMNQQSCCYVQTILPLFKLKHITLIVRLYILFVINAKIV